VTQDNSSLPIIGWREWLSIPDLGIPNIKAKVDTGARTSCLHTAGLELYTTDDGEERVKFQVHPNQNSVKRTIDCDWPVATHKSVRDSGGHEEIRPFIDIPVTLGIHTWEIQFSLTNRDNMKFRMLLGRRAMENRFLVDPVGSYLSSSRPVRRKKREL
jgi:hypothetical protein